MKKYLLVAMLCFLFVGITYGAIVTIDKNTWYEDRGIYAGLNEVKLHFKDTQGIQQDVLTCFPVKPTMSMVTIRLTDIREKMKPVSVIIAPIEIKLTDYTPLQIKNMMQGKTITSTTKWSTVLGITEETIPIGD